MKMTHQEVDKLYSSLGINNCNRVPRNNLNQGNMNRKLNSDFSAIMGDKGHMMWSSSTKNFKV